VSSRGAFLPVASTLQYLQRALQAPVALQEVISNGPFFAKLKFTLKFSSLVHHLPFSFLFNLKKIVRYSPVFIFKES
jgi:hypothetical protein